METAGITCSARGALASPCSISSSFISKSLKSSLLFGESLRIMPRSSLKVAKTKNSALVTKCEVGESLEKMTENEKWRGSVKGIVDAPIEEVWTMVSQTNRLPEWMPMIERCTDLDGEEGVSGYVRLLSGFMFPQEDGDRSWIRERLVSMDPSSHSYVYKMEASNVGLDGSVNSLKLIDYGDNSTLLNWSFEINPLEGVCEDNLIDYLGFLYKSCINRIEVALEASSQKVRSLIGMY